MDEKTAENLRQALEPVEESPEREMAREKIRRPETETDAGSMSPSGGQEPSSALAEEEPVYKANPAAIEASDAIIQGIDAALEGHADGQAEMHAWKEGIKLPPKESEQPQSEEQEKALEAERAQILADDLEELDDGFNEDDDLFHLPFAGRLFGRKKKNAKNNAKKNGRKTAGEDLLDDEENEGGLTEEGFPDDGEYEEGDPNGEGAGGKTASRKRKGSSEDEFDEDEYEEDGEDRLSEEEKRRIFSVSLKAGSHLLVIAIVLILAIVAANVAARWEYRNYDVIMSRKQEDTVAARYCRADRNILRYGTDGASLIDRSGDVLWDVSYSMTNPQVCQNGGKMAIYDKSGTGIVVCDANGLLGTISASLPIVKADVSASGYVTTIQEDSSGTWIHYYRSNGNEVAAIKTSMDNPGYPLDTAASGDGSMLAVAYLNFEDGIQKGVVNFYNFAAVGQNQMDNRVASFTYNDRIIPDLFYMNDTQCVAFRDDGFSIFRGETSIEEAASVTIEGEIRDIFHDSTRIGVLLDGEEGGSRILIYDADGEQDLDQQVEFNGQRAEIVGNEICLYNSRSEICVFDMSGKQKYEGSYNGIVKQVFGLDHRRFVVVSDNSVELIRLK